MRGGHLLTSGNRMKKQDPGAVEEKSKTRNRTGPDPDRTRTGVTSAEQRLPIMDHGSWIMDHGSLIKDQRLKIKYQGSWIKDLGPWTWHE